ncbi:MAG TPA: hypothetical protein VMI06_10945 [Terriglobia bacterium]|nr:hypothetical protein [Terriglobia bacterium]
MHQRHSQYSKLTLFVLIILIALSFPLFGASGSAPYTVAPTTRTPMPQLGNYGTNVDGSWHDNGPQVNKPFKNVFGLREVRVTDGSIPGGWSVGDGWRGPVNYAINYFSVYDSSFGGYWFYVPLDGGGNHLFKLDSSSMTVSPVCENWAGCLAPYAAEWSYATPGLMYYGSGSKVMEFNYDTNSGPTEVYDFSACPGILQYSNGDVGTLYVSRDDAVLANWLPNSEVFATYNRNTGVCNWISTQSGMEGGTNNPEGTLISNLSWIPNSLHTVAINGTGQWAFLTLTTPVNGLYDIFWQVGTTNVDTCEVYGWCQGHLALGNDSFFYVAGSPQTTGVSVPSHYDFALAPVTNVSNESLSNIVRLHAKGAPYFNTYAPDTECNVSDTHPNWNTNDSQPIIVSSFVDQLVPGFSLMQINCAWDHEIDAVASDGSGTTWRLAHNRASGLANQFSQPDSSYNALSMPVCSNDGKYCLWATDWEGSLGTQTANTTIGGIGCITTCVWQPNTHYVQGQEILGGWGNEQVAIQAGTSGSNAPSMAGHNGGKTHDGSVIWENQPGCNTNETIGVPTGGNPQGKGLCRTDVFIVEAK